ncbi:MAG TPA: sugar phosphate nucleotidyltransferase, partial [Acidimicrobiales bacterium]|nr:sugar phosphate nucleotidyltransferase [Acidimicrobiales bacterium]
MPFDRPDSLACMVLGAGAGRRLRPFTAAVPKPLLTILDRPNLDHMLDRIWALGDIPVFLNLHHAADVLDRHLAALNCPRLFWRREPELTGPAGALRLFAEELTRFETILVLSGDVIFADPLDR